MIKDLSVFAWRIGMVLIIAMPLLYITDALATFAYRGRGAPIVQLIEWMRMLVPYIFISMGVGCALCLLVRIERHLRPREETH